jgi:hypothetical protein
VQFTPKAPPPDAKDLFEEFPSYNIEVAPRVRDLLNEINVDGMYRLEKTNQKLYGKREYVRMYDSHHYFYLNASREELEDFDKFLEMFIKEKKGRMPTLIADAAALLPHPTAPPFSTGNVLILGSMGSNAFEEIKDEYAALLRQKHTISWTYSHWETSRTSEGIDVGIDLIFDFQIITQSGQYIKIYKGAITHMRLEDITFPIKMWGWNFISDDCFWKEMSFIYRVKPADLRGNIFPVEKFIDYEDWRVKFVRNPTLLLMKLDLQMVEVNDWIFVKNLTGPSCKKAIIEHVHTRRKKAFLHARQLRLQKLDKVRLKS